MAVLRFGCCTWNSHRPPAPKATGWSLLSYYTRSGSAPAKSPSRVTSAKSPVRQRLLRGSRQHNRAPVMPPLIGNKTTACLGKTVQLLLWSNSSIFHFAAPFEPSSTILKPKGSPQLSSVKESSSAFNYSSASALTPWQTLVLLQRAVVPIAP